MNDGEQDQRLAKLKQAQRQQSARGAAVQKLLETGGDGIEDKVVAVKTIQKADRPRVMSAFSRLLGQDDQKG